MFNVLILLSLGVAIGYAMRRVRFVKNAEKGVSVTVMLMLFTFGASIGADAGLMSNFAKYGVQAAILAVAGITGSLAAAYLLYLLSRKKSRKEVGGQ